MSKSISVLYLIRNEQGYIYKSINSIKEIADEIIVIDTGSIDRTVEICKSFTSKIFKYRWNNNFSEARNFGLSKCSKDYVMYINADEIISSEDVLKIKKILENDSLGAYGFLIQDCLGEWSSGDVSVLENSYSKNPQIRMFPNNKNIKFDGNVFESVDKSLSKIPNCSIFNSGVKILHHLFRGDPSGKKEITERYYFNIASSDEQIDNVEKMRSYKMDIDKEYINKKCAIVIACHNIPNITKRCIDSIQRNTAYPYKIIVVDNGSDKKGLEYARSLNNVELIEMNANTGVATARNAGIKKALKMSDVYYICLLDNDTEVYIGWLGKLICHLNANDSCGMVGPITTSAIGSQNLVKNSWIGRYSNDEIIDLIKNRGPKEYQNVNYLNRFCQVFKKEIIKSVGNIDETFGLIGREDQDFCERISNQGYSLNMLKTVFVYHKGHSTCSYNSIPYFKLIQGATKKYNEKWNINKKEKISTYFDKAVQNDEFDLDSLPYTSIVVLTYNNLDINRRFIDALEKFTDRYELIIIDNGSTDGTIEYLESLGDRIRLIKNYKNLGIAKGRNIGLRAARYNFLICLDNDQIVRENWLVELFKEINSGFDFVGVEAWRLNANLLPIQRYMSRNNANKIDYVGAGGCLMKRDVLDCIGIYDERFNPAYFEDCEICLRAKDVGYKIGWCDRPIINHLEHSTLIKGQKDFVYSDVMAASHKAFVEKRNGKKSGQTFKEYRLPSRKKVTFCMALKNRSERAINSIKSIINQKGSSNVDFYILEDISDGALSLDGVNGAEKINHIVVDTGFSWNKSILINQLIPRITSEYICFWDADFIYPEGFLEKYFSILEKTDFDKKYSQIMVTETCDSNKKGEIIAGGTLWGGFYTYRASHFIGVNGFDEFFVEWGYEDIDFNTRVSRAFNISPEIVRIKDFVYHCSHDDNIRGMDNRDNNKLRMDSNLLNKNYRIKPPTILEDKWRNKKMQVINKDTIAIICNGPSLRNVNLNLLKDKNIDSFTMNMSFRQWYKTGFWSKYWGCFDYVVTDNHVDEFKNFIEDKNVKTEKFFLLRKVSDSPKLNVLSFKDRKLYQIGKSFDTFGDVGNTGCNCCQVAILLGYKKIILLGADCNYVDFIDGSKRVGNKIVMEKTPENNPNYAWDDYNKKGDQYNVPNAQVFQMPGWKCLADYCESNNIQIVNCSIGSKIPYFRKNTLDREMTLY